MLNELLFLAAGEDAMRDLNDSVRSGSVLPVLWTAAVVAAWLVIVPCSAGLAKEAGWIWSPQHTKNKVPEGACYFRKTFTAQAPIRVQATIAADDEYELFVNGHEGRRGQIVSRSWTSTTSPSKSSAGRNTIAVKVTTGAGPTAALVARVFVRERMEDGTHTRATRRGAPVSIRWPFWNGTLYNDRDLGTGPDLWTTRGNRALGPRGRCGQ